MNNKSNVDSISRKIYNILMNEWDPIGVKGIREAENEYDSYLSDIHKILCNNKSEEYIYKYLTWVEVEHMGLVGDSNARRDISKKLYLLKY